MYLAKPDRYERMPYARCGASGLRLPRISLGLWHNFGDQDDADNRRELLLRAFDLGITHFDLANNYGPPAGAAERHFGSVLAADLKPYRDELIISTKAGYAMWPGPYGDWGSRKYVLSSLDQSLRRMGLDYVDIFYSHRPDPETPLEETMGALASSVRAGKALYVGLSNYNPQQTLRAATALRDLGTPCLIHQPRYHMFDRSVERGLLDLLAREKIGCIPFCPLDRGLLTNRYLNGIPADSRAGHDPRFLKPEHVTDRKVGQLRQLNALAQSRGQSLAQMSLAWVLRQPAITSVLIGASKVSQIVDNLGAFQTSAFSDEELAQVDRILGGDSESSL
jgi:L-glyceraldehyde 3-phosphate reductase